MIYVRLDYQVLSLDPPSSDTIITHKFFTFQIFHRHNCSRSWPIWGFEDFHVTWKFSVTFNDFEEFWHCDKNVHKTNERDMRHHAAAQIPTALHLLQHKGVKGCNFNDPESTKNTSSNVSTDIHAEAFSWKVLNQAGPTIIFGVSWYDIHFPKFSKCQSVHPLY